MKTLGQFLAEAYDKDVMGSSQIRRQGEGGRVGAMRKKTEPEKRRMKAPGGGKMVPAKDYKPRKDIGTQKKTSDKVQQPTKERGSAGLSLEISNVRQQWKDVLQDLVDQVHLPLQKIKRKQHQSYLLRSLQSK